MAYTATQTQVNELQNHDHVHAEAEQAVHDLSILFPNHSVLLNGHTVIVREYPFVQWLQLKMQHASFIEKFTALMAQDDDNILVDDILAFFEDEFIDVQNLLAQSIQKPVAFLNDISASEMESLMLAWWEVNKHFFLKSMVRTMRKQHRNIP